MKFLDFLQDVTVVGVVLALSLFLIDNPSDVDSLASAHSDAPPSLDDIVKPSNGLLDELINTLVMDADEESAEQLDVTEAIDSETDLLKTPSPLDLDALVESLEDEFGINSPETANPSEFLPEDFEAVELTDQDVATRALPSDELVPSAPSRPIYGVQRAFDDTDLFDRALANGNYFGDDDLTTPAAPEPTRRLGPVEFLTPPM